MRTLQNAVLECKIMIKDIHLCHHLNPELDEKFVDLILWNWSRGNPAKSIARVLEEKEEMDVLKKNHDKPEQRGSGSCPQSAKL